MRQPTILKNYLEFTAGQETVVSLGNFDGVHLGHQCVLSLCMREAKRHGCLSIFLTFDPHPASVLKNRQVDLLLNVDERTDLLSRYAPDFILNQKFDESFSRISAEDFVREILIKTLKTKWVVIGKNFRFGENAVGDSTFLKTFSEFNVHEVESLESGGMVVSSSRIRNHLKAAELSDANTLMGYPYFVNGTVVQGDGRGRVLGFPTVNVKTTRSCLLPFGVYATIVEFKDGQRFCGVANFGVRPTFERGPSLLEIHLLDFQKQVYGDDLRIFFLERFRPENRFDSKEALVRQIREDVHHAESFFKARNFSGGSASNEKNIAMTSKNFLQSFQLFRFP